MKIQHILKSIGLKRNEINIYLYLLESGVSTPPQIAQGTHIARTHCYNILRSLQNKHLVSSQKRGKRMAYIARTPKALLNSLDRKKEAIEQILPDLEAIHTVQKNKPTIRFYDGFEEVKQIYEESLSAKEIFSIASLKHLKSLDNSFYQWYQKQLKKKDIVVHDIVTAGSKESGMRETKKILKGLYDVAILPSYYGESGTDILTWDNTLVCIALEPPIFGTVIVNSPIARTFKIIFRALQDRLPQEPAMSYRQEK